MPTGSARRRAREVAFRLVYQADVMAEPLETDWSARCAEEPLGRDGSELVDDVLGVLRRRPADVDDLIRSAAKNWELDRLAATDRSVLRIAAAELIGRPGTPARVVLDEAIEIARRFGSEESARFVNGVLDHVARSLRPGEV
ncbi:MAG: transcription antitermination factor NusB [Candidatus Eiseniibacteriota bacterium]